MTTVLRAAAGNSARLSLEWSFIKTFKRVPHFYGLYLKISNCKHARLITVIGRLANCVIVVLYLYAIDQSKHIK